MSLKLLKLELKCSGGTLITCQLYALLTVAKFDGIAVVYFRGSKLMITNIGRSPYIEG